MCCFIVPLAQAVVTTAMRRQTSKTKTVQNKWIKHLSKLELMLWGGTAMLIVDHILNNELTWRFPFFTALEQQGGAYTMLEEMMTVGIPMSLLVTLIYTLLVVREGRKKNITA